MRRTKIALVIVFLLVLAAGCAGISGGVPGGKTDEVSAKASAQLTAWKALMAGKQTYDAAFKALALLEANGKLSTEAKAKAIKYGNLYMQAHNQAAQLLLDGKTPDLAMVSKALDVLLLELAPYYTGGK